MKSLSIIAALVMSLFCGFAAHMSAATWVGDGSAASPYLITSATEFDSLRRLPSGGSGLFFRLAADIAFDPASFSPIPLFCGSLDGAGHEISYHYSTVTDSAALFHELGTDANIRELTLGGSISANSCVAALSIICRGRLSRITNRMKVSASLRRSAGLVLVAEQSARIDSCINLGAVSGAEGFVAGLVLVAKGQIYDCENAGTLTANSYVGGIVGQLYDAAVVANCQNTADIILPQADIVAGIAAYSTIKLSGYMLNCSNRGRITARQYAGGVAGRMEAGFRMDSCTNFAAVTAINRYAGGIVAQVDGDPQDESQISACTNHGQVAADGDYAGGIAGFLYSNASAIGCLNLGNVNHSGNGGAWFGGIAGMAFGTLTGCTNAAAVTAPGCYAAGGLCGSAESGFQASDCCNTGAVTASSAPNRGTKGIAGGLAGDATQAVFVNCFNLGTISADEALAGLVGMVHSDVAFTACYNAGAVSAHMAGSDIPVGAVSCLAPDAAVNTISCAALYFDSQVCHRTSAFDMQFAHALSTRQMCMTAPSGAFSTAHWCYPLLASPTPQAILASACIGFEQPSDNESYVNYGVYLGVRPGLEWTLSPCFRLIKEGFIEPVEIGTSMISVRETTTGQSRSWQLTVHSCNRVNDIESDILSTAYFDLNGLSVTAPLSGKIYLVFRKLANGTLRVTKEIHP